MDTRIKAEVRAALALQAGGLVEWEVNCRTDEITAGPRLADLFEVPNRPATVAAKGTQPSAGKRTRRIGKELIAFSKMLTAERKKGLRVEDIANKHGVSTAYIYQLGG